MITYQKGNLLDVQSGIIAHGCNTLGVMGAGVALAVKNKYPKVFEYYEALCMTSDPDTLIGQNQIVRVSPDLEIANCFTQKSFGISRSSDKQVSYDAVADCFNDLYYKYRSEDITINIPKIGSGLGGGKWSVIEAIINEYCEINVTVWSL